MNCEEVREHLTARIDGELAEAVAARLDSHLTQCAACEEERAARIALREIAYAWEVEGGGDVWEALRREIEQPDLATVLDEMRKLRAEVQALRAEVADLRRQRSAYPSAARLPKPSARAFPYAAAPSDLPINIP